MQSEIKMAASKHVIEWVVNDVSMLRNKSWGSNFH
jgi:hypothetical protein